MLKNLKLMLPALLLILLKSQVDTSDPSTIVWFRVFFGLGQAFLIGTLLYILFGIKNNPNGSKQLKVSKSDLEPSNPLASLMGNGNDSDSSDSSNSSNSSNCSENLEEVSVAQYDEKLWWNKFRQQSVGLVVIPIVHIKFGTAIPLVMSILIAAINLIDDPLFRLFIRNQTETEFPDLKRPFKPQPSMFQGLMDAQKKLQAQMDENNESNESKNGNDTVKVTKGNDTPKSRNNASAPKKRRSRKKM